MAVPKSSPFGNEYKVSGTGWLCGRPLMASRWLPIFKMTKEQIDAWNHAHGLNITPKGKSK
jgi:hypothetical protein